MINPYTPGPWNLHTPDEGDPTTGDGTFCITAKSMVIANAQPSDWHETPANARLIAAAPELLECLKWAATFAEGTRDIPGSDLDNPRFNGWIDDCNRAIAKAEGKTV